MNKEEIEKALKIIRQPITVNCKDYYYFDQENYNNLLRVYENCQWFINNYEQLIVNLEVLQQKVNQLETNRDEAYKLLEDIDEYMLVEQHLKLVEAKKLLERGKE